MTIGIHQSPSNQMNIPVKETLKKLNIAKAAIQVWTAQLFYKLFKIYVIDFTKEGIILHKIIPQSSSQIWERSQSVRGRFTFRLNQVFGPEFIWNHVYFEYTMKAFSVYISGGFKCF